LDTNSNYQTNYLKALKNAKPYKKGEKAPNLAKKENKWLKSNINLYKTTKVTIFHGNY